MSQPDLSPSAPEHVADNAARAPEGWWVRSVRAAPSAISRRAALQGILAVGGVIVAASVGIGEAAAQDDGLLRTETRRAIEMQRQFGWSFGAATETVTFDGAAVAVFDRSALARMPDDLRPARVRHAPFYVPTLFQSPPALPRAVPAGDAGAVVPLRDALQPIFTTAMGVAYQRGRALAAQFHNVWSKAAVVVDLPGPEAVAFAAGAAEVLDPVFLFDNWPHPRGVVPSHLTLAAAAYYQPLFVRRAAPAGAPPLFVLDRDRLAPYTDDAEQFDNRYMARLPSAAALRSIDVANVLYVGPTADSVELDDLNDDFLFYAAAGLDVKIVAADAFMPGGAGPDLRATPYVTPGGMVVREEEQRRYRYGGSQDTDAYFWIDYPWIKPPPHMTGRVPLSPRFPRPGAYYHPTARITQYASGMRPHELGPAPAGYVAAAPLPHPLGFGQVKVVVSTPTGAILGAAMSRSGSWNRTFSNSAGG